MNKNNIYNSDYERVIYYTNVLDPSFLVNKTNLKDDRISKLKTAPNITSKIISKFLQIPIVRYDLDDVEEFFAFPNDLKSSNEKNCSHDSISSWLRSNRDWENYVLMNLSKKEDLVRLCVILKTFNLNPPMVDRLERYIKVKPDSLIEKIYEHLFPNDEIRNYLKAEKSFLLYHNILNQLNSVQNRNEYLSDEVCSGYEDQGKVISPSYILKTLMATDYLAREFDDNYPYRSLSWVIKNFSQVNPAQIIALCMIEQYKDYLTASSWEEVQVRYSDGSIGMEYIETQDQHWELSRVFAVSSEGLTLELINSLLSLGFIKGETGYLFFYFDK